MANKIMTATEIMRRNEDYYSNPPVGSEVAMIKEFIAAKRAILFKPLIKRAKELLKERYGI